MAEWQTLWDVWSRSNRGDELSLPATVHPSPCRFESCFPYIWKVKPKAGDGNCLENRRGVKALVGSTPTPSVRSVFTLEELEESPNGMATDC